MKKEIIEELAKTNELFRNPLNPRQLVVNNKCLVELDDIPDGYGILSNSLNLKYLSSLEKNKGFGTEIMKIITEIADRKGIKLTLHPKPLGKDGLNKKALVVFYKKFGFVYSLGQKKYMVRLSKNNTKHTKH
jgi:hypothetical protein